MIRQGTRGESIADKAAIRRKVGAYALTAGVFALAWLPSAARAAEIPTAARARLPADHTHDGNGHHNSTALSVRSPIHNHGYQHTNNRNAGGVSDTQNAFCRNVRVCTVKQNVTVVAPERTAAPAGSDPVATPETRTVPETRTPPGRLLYMGPYGLMLMDGGSAGPAAAGDERGPAGSFECPANFFPGLLQHRIVRADGPANRG
ncbi:hypothetical protein [Actinoallomurus sp. NPDC050550]|uniref:hypothetical protein n=1 Tax=Actinoallomurus sp. NPDC050550 TaxID=3154937 RepID=UPI0033EA195D